VITVSPRRVVAMAMRHQYMCDGGRVDPQGVESGSAVGIYAHPGLPILAISEVRPSESEPVTPWEEWPQGSASSPIPVEQAPPSSSRTARFPGWGKVQAVSPGEWRWHYD
jgi:hypothetical protein